MEEELGTFSKTIASPVTSLPTVVEALSAQTSVKTKWSGKAKSVAKPLDFSPILALPVEILILILIKLPPPSLSCCQRVSRRFNDIIEDERSWKEAFETNFGLGSFGRRLHLTWKREYVARVALYNRWIKSRTASLNYETINSISNIFIIYPLLTSINGQKSSSIPAPTLVSISLFHGRAQKSHPFTGTTLKNLTPLDASPTNNLGQQNQQFPIMETISSASNGKQIIWGMENGSIRISTISGSSLTERTWGGVGLRSIENAHGDRDVLAIEFGTGVKKIREEREEILERFATVGADQRVIIWTSETLPLIIPVGGVISGSAATRATLPRPRDQAAARILWSATIPQPSASPITFTNKISFDAGNSTRLGTVAIGMDNGDVHVWNEIVLLEDGEMEGRTLKENYFFFPSKDVDQAIDFLFLDPATQHTPLGLLAHQTGTNTFTRYIFSSDSSPPRVTRFGQKPSDITGIITAIACDFDEAKIASTLIDSTPPADSIASPITTESTKSFGNRKYVAAGCADGRTFLFDWEMEFTEEESEKVVEPTFIIPGEAKVTALALSSAAIYVGSIEGSIRVYDNSTSCSHLRTFSSKAPARILAQLGEEGRVTQIILPDLETVFASIGSTQSKILSWKTSEEVIKKKSGKSGRGGIKSERIHSAYAMRDEVEDSIHDLSTDSISRIASFQRNTFINLEYGLPPSLDNMTEAEAIEFALLLSNEDAENSWLEEIEHTEWIQSVQDQNSPAFSARDGETDHDEEDLDEFNLNDDLNGDGNGSRSISLSIPTSPSIRGTTLSITGSTSTPARSTSQSWKPSSLHSSPSTSHTPSSYDANRRSNEKVQLSPRLGPTYGSASRSFEPVPDMSEELWPMASSPSGSAFSPARASPVPSTPAIRRGWAEVASSGTSSPSITRIGTIPSSMLTESLSRSNTQLESEARMRREEEDFKFALELSLAEEQSRLEN